jgi:processive 1,2-diacylglycerol beta-glucosyltransferase
MMERVGHLPHVHVFQFVDSIGMMMDAADVLITKPGGLSTSEAIQKEIPVLLTKGFYGQEEENIKYLTSIHAATYVDPNDVLQSVHNLFAQPNTVAEMKQAMKTYKHQMNALSLDDLVTITKKKFNQSK